MSERYAELTALFHGLGDDSPSTLQGFVAGLMGGGAPEDQSFWLLAMERFLDLDAALDGGQQDALASLAKWIFGQLSGDGFGFELLLPDEDDVGIDGLAEALQQWAHGYLIGFGTAGKGESKTQYSEDVQSALTDMAAISQMEAEPEEDEEAANALMEIEEYLKVTAQLIFVENATSAVSGDDEDAGPDETLH